jgi:hypothetical protein
MKPRRSWREKLADSKDLPRVKSHEPGRQSAMKNSPPKKLLEFLKPYDPKIRKLALALRALVIAEMAPCCENIYDAYNAVAIGYGPTDRLKDGVFHIAVYAKHVNLGFNRGVSLADPRGILKGTGTSVRHITIASLDELARPEVRSYVRRARRAAGHPAPKPGGDVVSVVKAIYPTRRRPNTNG